jgi:tRNA(Ile)-lysidine synthase
MILERVKQYINDKQLLTDGERVIVGLSGGADSVALLDMLISLEYKCVAAHCNFHLRGAESDRDAAFVEKLCKDRGIELQLVEFDTTKFAKENSVSIEMAARELRYKWFEELCISLDIEHIAIAHHRDDSVETVLLNLTRGTGIRGLTGISAHNGKIIRPMLGISRYEILHYLHDKNLSYVIDSTNNEDIYTRNKLRLNVIPFLESINPSVKEAINRTSEHLSQVANIYGHYIEQAKKQIIDGNHIKIDDLLKQVEPEAVLYEILSPYGFNSAVVKQIFESVNSISGKRFYSDKYVLVKDRNCFIVDKINENKESEIYFLNESEASLKYPITLEMETIENSSSFSIERDNNILYLDKSKLKYPLVLRHWQQGDWFIPFGMSGRKKLSDYFSDNKFSIFDKENVWVLCSGEDIVWLVGYRSDNRYRITEKTNEILKISKF